jgi:hypothetical protein
MGHRVTTVRARPDSFAAGVCQRLCHLIPIRTRTGTERQMRTYDIFEGTEQIQQLVISRAISGLRIE